MNINIEKVAKALKMDSSSIISCCSSSDLQILSLEDYIEMTKKIEATNSELGCPI